MTSLKKRHGFDEPIPEEELALLLGFSDELKDYGFGLGDFKEAIKKGPIKDSIIDRFFESTSDSRHP